MTVVINTPLYQVSHYEHDEVDEGVFDWTFNTGEDSDEWFETAEDAERDARDSLGLTDDMVVLTRAEHAELLDYKWRYEELNK